MKNLLNSSKFNSSSSSIKERYIKLIAREFVKNGLMWAQFDDVQGLTWSLMNNEVYATREEAEQEYVRRAKMYSPSRYAKWSTSSILSEDCCFIMNLKELING